MNKIILLYLFCIASVMLNSSTAQEVLSLEKALEIAHSNHPAIKAAAMLVEREKTMLKSNVSIDKTQFSYTHGQINSEQIDYYLSVNQSFKIPSYGARKELLQAKMQAGESNLSIAKSEINKAVRNEFVAISILNRKIKLYKEQEERFLEMKAIATKKQSLGLSNVLEQTIAESNYQEMKIKREKTEMELISKSTNLSLLLYSEVKSITIDTSLNIQLPLIDSSQIAANPLLEYYKSSIDIKEKEVTLNKKEFLPDFNLGYFNQQIEGLSGHQGVQFGVNIPLFYRQQKATLNASKIDVTINTQEMEAYRLSLQKLFIEKMQHFNQFALEINYFESIGNELSNQLSNFAVKSYSAGEIGYLEYIESLNQMMNIQLNYLLSLQNYNSEIIELLYLTGQ